MAVNAPSPRAQVSKGNMAVNAPSPRAQPEDKGRLLPYYPRQHVLTIILPVT